MFIAIQVIVCSVLLSYGWGYNLLLAYLQITKADFIGSIYNFETAGLMRTIADDEMKLIAYD